MSEPADRETPKTLHDRHWAMLLLERALDALRMNARPPDRAPRCRLPTKEIITPPLAPQRHSSFPLPRGEDWTMAKVILARLEELRVSMLAPSPSNVRLVSTCRAPASTAREHNLLLRRTHVSGFIRISFRSFSAFLRVPPRPLRFLCPPPAQSRNPAIRNRKLFPCQLPHQRSSGRTFCSAARTSDLPDALCRLPRAQPVFPAHKSPDYPHQLSNARSSRKDERTGRLPVARSARTECFSRLPRPLSSLPRPQVV